MASRNERRGRRRGKRRRDSSREGRDTQAGFPAGDYASPSNIHTPGTSLDRSSAPSRTGPEPGPGPGSDYTGLVVERQDGQPANIVTSLPPPGKVAIPALRPSQTFESSMRGSKKGRTSHACDSCRKAKAGCTGEQPCSRCKTTGTPCVYGDGKREHDRKMMTKLTRESASLNQHNTEVTDALRRLQLDTSLSPEGVRAALDDIIAMAPNPASPSSRGGSIQPSRRKSSEREGHETSGEDDPNDIGSTGSLDVINVDTDRDDTRATGHLGKASAVSWAKRTNEELQRSSLQPKLAGGGHETGYTLSSYHVEDADVEYVDTRNVRPYDWPEYSLADRLVRIYFDHTHEAFPILERKTFMEKYYSFSRGSTDLDFSNLIWLGTLNVVFAISAVFGDLTNHEDQGHVDDHLIYCARAKALCLDQDFLFQDPRLSTTCFLGLLSLYYVSNCKTNRAWTICGLALRNALTLGLHVRSEVGEISDVEKEHRVRLWWSLYSIEVSLNERTGRPSCIADRDVSTPLPVNIDENDFQPNRSLYERQDSVQSEHTESSRRSSRSRPSATYEMPIGYTKSIALSFPVVELPLTSSTYFIYRTQLSIISHEIVTQLYCAATTKEKWFEVQDTMKTIDRRLISWRDSLTKEFDITFDTYSEPDWNDSYALPRIGLAIAWNSSRMILFRPCLCRFEGRLDHQSQMTRNFEQEAVEHCIDSARRMISLLKWIARSEAMFYSISPWWDTLHYLCEAISVLMLEMAFEAQHLPDQKIDILTDAGKGIFWLTMLSAGSIAARKAWEIFDNLIRLVAVKMNWSVSDLPTSASIPARYNWRRFGKATADPWNQRSQESLQEHQASLPLVPDLITAWANQDLHQSSPQHTAPEQFGNQLHSSAAVERFANMGQLHAHYDDPWPQFLDPTAVTSPMGMNIATSQPFSTVANRNDAQFLARSFFDMDVGVYDTLSPTAARGFQQGPFEGQEQGDVDRREQSEFGGFGTPGGRF